MKDFIVEIIAVVLACWLADAGIWLGRIITRRRGRRQRNPNLVR